MDNNNLQIVVFNDKNKNKVYGLANYSTNPITIIHEEHLTNAAKSELKFIEFDTSASIKNSSFSDLTLSFDKNLSIVNSKFALEKREDAEMLLKHKDTYII